MSAQNIVRPLEPRVELRDVEAYLDSPGCANGVSNVCQSTRVNQLQLSLAILCNPYKVRLHRQKKPIELRNPQQSQGQKSDKPQS